MFVQPHANFGFILERMMKTFPEKLLAKPRRARDGPCVKQTYSRHRQHGKSVLRFVIRFYHKALEYERPVSYSSWRRAICVLLLKT